MNDAVTIPIRRSLLRSAAPWLAFAVLIGASVLLIHWQVEIYAFSKQLVQIAKQGWYAGSPLGLWNAFWAVLAFCGLKAVAVLFLFGVCLGVEITLTGEQPSDWRRVFIHCGFWLLLAGYSLAATPILNAIMPMPSTSLLVIDYHQLPLWLAGAQSAVVMVLFVLCYDFVSYFTHRLQHKVPLLWHFHAVHHSIESADGLSNFSHPVDGLLERLGMVTIALLIGFRFESVILLQAWLDLHTSLVHTRAPINFGPLGNWIADNRYHRIHHTPIEAQSGINFGSITTIWDRVFGTYRAPQSNELPPTGLADRRSPRTISQFVLARLPRTT